MGRRWRLPDSVVLPHLRWWPAVTVIFIIAMAAALDRGVGSRRASSAVDAEPGAEADQRRYHDRKFRVARVVDGDTIDLDEPDGRDPVTRVRLWGVDSPEIASAGGGSMHFGPEASAFARETLEGRDVHLVLSPKRTRDKYRRVLAYVFLERGGVMFNELLAEEGCAYADRRFAHHFKDRFESAENRARAARRGLWRNATNDDFPGWYRRMVVKAEDTDQRTAGMSPTADE